MITIAVVGAHLRGQPLNPQLTARDAVFETETETAAEYRLYALETVPPKPGLVRVVEGGSPIALELWSLEDAAFASFVAEIPSPLGIGKLVLADGRVVPGFIVEPYALESAADITAFGGWRAYRASLERPPSTT